MQVITDQCVRSFYVHPPNSPRPKLMPQEEILALDTNLKAECEDHND